MHRRFILTLAILLGAVSVAQAVPNISLADLSYVQGSGVHQLQVQVTGGDPVPGMNFIFELLGPSGLAIQSIDIITGTIFAANHTPVAEAPGQPPQTHSIGVTTVSGTVAATGLIGTVSIDVGNVVPGTYFYRMSNVTNLGDTDFTLDANLEPINASFTYTTTFPALTNPPQDPLPPGASRLIITQAPEPGSIVMALFSLTGFGYVVLRRRRVA